MTEQKSKKRELKYNQDVFEQSITEMGSPTLSTNVHQLYKPFYSVKKMKNVTLLLVFLCLYYICLN